jgi:hypothetical protein
MCPGSDRRGVQQADQLLDTLKALADGRRSAGIGRLASRQKAESMPGRFRDLCCL